MKILSFYIIDDTKSIIGAFLAPFYGGDSIHPVVIHGINSLDYTKSQESILFDNYNSAHKHAYLSVFSEEDYKVEYGD